MKCLDFERLAEWHDGLIQSIEPFKGYGSPVRVDDRLRYRSNGAYAEPIVEVILVLYFYACASDASMRSLQKFLSNVIMFN